MFGCQFLYFNDSAVFLRVEYLAIPKHLQTGCVTSLHSCIATSVKPKNIKGEVVIPFTV